MMGALEALLAREACMRLCLDIAVLADARDAAGLAQLFTEDGVFERLGQVFRGREAIRQAIAARPAEVWSRHYPANIRIDIADDGRSANGSSYLLMFRGKAGVDGHELIHAEYLDEFALTAEGWRFSARKVSLRP
ncbi:MAG: nuclear transport factor 2 family protein [Rhodocyclaceae bacterium]|nr:nuclear transport factor 2 family protein [Rhodocyclaceae bacterium]